MAEGFEKWVQTSEEISNPFMGKRMLACGSASTWR
jgi:membrane fusion protein, copper/silver efflux system